MKRLNSENSLENALQSIAFFLLIIFLAILFLRPVETGDIWWHLSAGKIILESAQVPAVDPFPFANEQTPWTYTQWLGGCIFYLSYLCKGIAGLQFFRVFLFLLILAVFFIYARKNIPFAILLPFILIIALHLAPRALLRPFVFNFLFIQLFLIILFAHLNHHKTKPLLAIPLLGLVWVNIHLGSFYYGTLLIGTFLLSQIINYFNAKNKANQEQTSLAKTKIRQLTMTLFCYFLCFLFTPYGIKGFLYPFQTIFLLDQSGVNRAIGELLPPTSSILSEPHVLALLFVAILTLIINRKNDFTHMLLIVFSFFLFFYGRRAIAFFALIAAYVIIQSLKHLSFKAKWEALPHIKIVNCSIHLLMIIILSSNIIHFKNLKSFVYGRPQPHLSINQDHHNLSHVLRILKTHKITGKVFNDDRYGGYLLWHAYPDLKPFIDSRQINYDALRIYHDIRRDPQNTWPSLADAFEFKIVLLDASKIVNNKLLHYFINHDQWKLIFVNASQVVFVKKGEFALPKSFDEYLARLQLKPLTAEELSSLNATIDGWKDEKPSMFLELKKILNPSYTYIDYAMTGMTLFELGFKEAGIHSALKAYSVADNLFIRFLLSTMRDHYISDNPQPNK